LGRSGDVLVTPRDSVFALKGKSVDAQALGKMLGVRNIVISSLRKSPPGYRVSFQIVDTKNGQVIDSADVGAASRDGSAPENRLALTLFSAMAPVINLRWRAYELARPPDDKDPENLSARMTRLADTGGLSDLPEFKRILAAARTAIPNDNDLRAPFDMQACNYLQDLLGGGLYRSDAERTAWADQALALGVEAGALRPNATSSHVCRAAAFGALERWDEGMAEAQYIVDTYPLTANGYVARAGLEFARGQFDSALKDYTEVSARTRGDPSDIGATRLFMGDYGPAVDALRQQSVLDPKDPSAPFYLSAALQLSGKHADAVAEARTYRMLKTDDSLWRNLALSHEPAFLARAAVVRKGLHDAGLDQTPTGS
jgi:tetratricopeptide (TPR) repeat protein